MTEWNPKIGFVGVEEEPPLSNNMNVDSTINSSNATKRTSTSSKKRKSPEAYPELPQLVHMVTIFCDLANIGLGLLTRVFENEFDDPDKRGLVLEAVEYFLELMKTKVFLLLVDKVNEPKDI
ncbi:hypothetical protein Salat_1890400 [Sesamum alatum]|uniref:Uncharacterized protein n=1 Tax=Sesamum alatum TaxID=300844 RepID=A0AAE2CI60_9LAMI|nr:hypothetical protein Salat_1890400 [Sesamum alatum]